MAGRCSSENQDRSFDINYSMVKPAQSMGQIFSKHRQTSADWGQSIDLAH